MSDYTVQINWSGKDSLPDSSADKIISGADFQTEFDAIETAVSTKADAGDFQSVYPVGSIYMNATNNTNPGTLFGFGTWVSFGAGRMPVGFDSSNSNFNSAEETGGSADATLVSHTHTGTTATDGSHSHTVAGGEYSGSYDNGTNFSNNNLGSTTGSRNHSADTSTHSGHTHTFTTSSSGSSATDKNLPPYITVYMWKRTA